MAVGTRLISSLQGMGALFRLNLVHIGHDQCRTAKMPSLRAGGLCHRTKPPIHPRFIYPVFSATHFHDFLVPIGHSD